MKRLIAAVAAALLLTSHGGAAAAPLARIDGRIDYYYSYVGFVGPNAPIVQLSDTVAFNQEISPNTLTTFALSAQAPDRVGAAVVVRVGDGWTRFNGTALTDISATPYGVDAAGDAYFSADFYVSGSITIDAPNRTGQAGSATLGFLVDGVLSAASENYPDRSEAQAGGLAELLVGFGSLFVTTLSDVTGRSGVVSTWDPDASTAVGYDEVFLGGTVDFVFGTPFAYGIRLETSGGSYALSLTDFGAGLGGQPAVSTMVSDFGNTITWAGVSDLLDAEGNAVTDFTAFSSSGTDFRYRIVPDDIDPPGNVPEPSTALLLLAGLAALSRRRSIVRTAGGLSIRR